MRPVSVYRPHLYWLLLGTQAEQTSAQDMMLAQVCHPSEQITSHYSCLYHSLCMPFEQIHWSVSLPYVYNPSRVMVLFGSAYTAGWCRRGIVLYAEHGCMDNLAQW